MNRKEGSSRPRSEITEENTDLIEELICSQEEVSHTHLAPRKIAEETGMSRSSVRRMIKRRSFCNFKRVKITKMNEMNDGCRNRRYACGIESAEKFEHNTAWLKNSMARWKRFYPGHSC